MPAGELPRMGTAQSCPEDRGAQRMARSQSRQMERLHAGLAGEEEGRTDITRPRLAGEKSPDGSPGFRERKFLFG